MNKFPLRSADCGLRNYPLPRRERTKVRGNAPNGACPRMIPSGELPAPNCAKLALRCLLTTIALLGMMHPSIANAISGREVYEKVHEQRSRSLDRKTEVTMVLFDRGGGKRTRKLTEYGKKSDPEAYKVLIVFKSPPDLKNVGFLIHAHTFADRDLWAYFPEYKRVRRIATSSQDDSFFGSDFSYDDFGGPPDLDDYTFSILKEEAIDAKPCYVVEVTPKIHRKYTKYIAWVAKDLWIHLKIDYYQDNAIYRTGVFTDIRIIDGIPTPFKMIMENKKTNHRTELAVESIKYHTQFADDLFSQRSLERAGK
jgi:outer membrane lipoprotein-sorting protein